MNNIYRLDLNNIKIPKRMSTSYKLTNIKKTIQTALSWRKMSKYSASKPTARVSL